MNLNEPTPEQCSEKSLVYEDKDHIGHAIWYPQMGGYLGKAVVVFEKSHPDGCFEAYIWHDGEFPVTEENCRPIMHFHHCMSEQFIAFGERVAELATAISAKSEGS